MGTPAPSPPAGRERIAILGGGVGAVAAAFSLTDGPNRDKYDVTVYQVGWRLGGKGASSRATRAQRIEEHGMHIWFGFYENALAMMERCYDELGDPNDTFANAFTDQSFVVLEDKHEGKWVHFPIVFPPGPPGRPPTALECAKAVLRWILDDWNTHAAELGAPPSDLDEAPRLLDAMRSTREEKTVQAFVLALDRVRDAAKRKLDRLVGEDTPPVRAPEVLGGTLADKARWTRMVWEIGLAVARGMAVDGVLWRGFHVIDHRDLWEWLEEHGAPERQKYCVMVRGLYTQAFAFPNGREEDRSMAAGSSLRAALRMLLGYRGAFMRKMRAGMGDIVFGPFYRLLRRRGVHFKFFHRVKALHVASDDPTLIGKISLGRQVSLRKKGAHAPRPPSCCPDEPAYDPLITVRDPSIGTDRHCWPDGPLEKQIKREDVAKIHAMKAASDQYFNLESVWTSWDERYETECTLERGTHFDHVVLAISVGALGRICAELAERDAKWKSMLATMVTVRTQAAQLWLAPTLEQLGWTWMEPVNGAYAFPLDSWASMNQTRSPEAWPAGYDPREIAYLCGVLPHDEKDPEWFSDPAFPRRQRQKVEAWLKTHLATNMGHLWPHAIAGGQFRWELLVDLDDATNEQRLQSQFLVANVDPTERYVLSVPASMAHRLPSDASGFRNLVLAGDWTRNTVNLGCVEAAVSSAMVASRKISGHPRTVTGESDS